MKRAVLLVLAMTACGGTPRFAGVSPERIPELEATGDLRELGQAYFAAGRFADARRTLEQVVADDPSDVESQAYLAFTLDELLDFTAARTAYRALVQTGEAGIAGAARERLALLDRKQAVLSARDALAREIELAGTAPRPNTVAVLPFLWAGTDEELAPLARGFSELLVTDLALLSGLTVVERLNVSALIEEMRLGGSGLVDPATAARSGRLLQASDVVQGTIAGDRDALRVDAALVGASGAVRGSAQASDPLERLFEIEATIVFALAERMGISMDPATRARIAERPTQNVLAFLAFSQGLIAQDAGDFARAGAQFEQAVRLDPGFQAARTQAQHARSLSQAAGASPVGVGNRVATGAQRARLRETVARVAPSGADRLRDRANRGVLDRKAIQESTRTEGPGDAAASTTIVGYVKRPGR
jgi:TolB-like protein